MTTERDDSIDKKMLGHAFDLRADLKYAFEQGEGQTPHKTDVEVMDWLIQQAKKVRELEEAVSILRLPTVSPN